MKRGTIFIILFLLIAAAIVGASYFFQSRPPVNIRVAVHPLAEDWVRAATDRLNAENPIVNNTQRVRYVLEVADDLQVWNAAGSASGTWSPADHPDAWIPALSASVGYAGESGLPFATVADSIALTPLVWGGFSTAVDRVTNSGAVPVSWTAVAAHLGDIEPAFPNPPRSAQGLAAAIAAAADFAGTPQLAGANVRGEFYTFFQPILGDVPNFNTFGSSIAQYLATRGTDQNIALLPESEWVLELRGRLVNTANPVELVYPQFAVVFDFPFVQWTGASDPNSAQAANAAAIQAGVQLLAERLISPEEQAAAGTFGLRPADGTPLLPDATRFNDARAYGVQPAPDLTARVQFPGRNDVRALISWLIPITR